MESKKIFKVLIGCTASLESRNVINLVTLLQGLVISNHSVEIQVVATPLALELMPVQELEKICKVYKDADEWEEWEQNKKVLHIELRRWADIFIIAPINADTLGRIAIGLCDNLLTCIVRAWDLSRPLIFCPSMDARMWHHPITATHVSKLKEYGYIEVPCKTGKESIGEMAEIEVIFQKVKELLSS